MKHLRQHFNKPEFTTYFGPYTRQLTRTGELGKDAAQCMSYMLLQNVYCHCQPKKAGDEAN